MHVLQLGTVIHVLSWSYIVNSQYGLYCRNLLFSYLPALKSKKITYNIEQDSNSAFIVFFFLFWFGLVFFAFISSGIITKKDSTFLFYHKQNQRV